MPVPPTPAALRERVAAALAGPGAVTARPLLRPFIISGLVVAGVAAAAALTLSRQGEDLVAAVAAPAQATPPAAADSPTPALETAFADPAAAGADARPATTGTSPALDPRKIVVVLRPEAAADAPAIALAQRCHDAFLVELRAVDGLRIVTDPAVHRISTFSDWINLPERDRLIAHGQGAGKLMQVSTMHGCNFALFDTTTGKLAQEFGGGGVDPAGGMAEAFSQGMARGLGEKLLTDPSTALTQSRARLLDPRLSDADRLVALNTLVSQMRGSPDPHAAVSIRDSHVLAAAIELGTKSSSAEVRSTLWAIVRGVDDKALVQPLLQALASDADFKVRMQAAVSLKHFLDEPGVLAALQKAAAEDPDNEPRRDCFSCWTVRDAALRSSISNSDFRAWALSNLMDERLPPRDRVLPFAGRTMDGRMPRLANYGEEANATVFDIGRRSGDPQIREIAWSALWLGKTDTSVIPVLLGDLNNHENQYVRAAAAKALTQHVSLPEVREALQRATGDSSLDVRRAASDAMESASP